MLKIEFKLTSKDPTAQWGKLKTVFRTFEPELKVIGRDIVRYFTDDVFETEGAVFGERWQELSPAYAVRKAKKYAGRGILQASGEMRRGYRLFTTAQYATIKNMAVNARGQHYAQFHQEGGGNLPQRILTKVDRNKAKMISDEFKRHIQGRIAQALR